MQLKPYLEDRENGINRKEFQQWYYKTYLKVIGRDRATDILKILDGAGLVVEQPDPLDKRFLRYVLPDLGVKKSSQNEVESEEIFTPECSNTYLCSYCEAKGQRVFFATKADLQQHLQKVHGVW
jgi:hypothetical protein